MKILWGILARNEQFLWGISAGTEQCKTHKQTANSSVLGNHLKITVSSQPRYLIKTVLSWPRYLRNIFLDYIFKSFALFRPGRVTSLKLFRPDLDVNFALYCSFLFFKCHWIQLMLEVPSYLFKCHFRHSRQWLICKNNQSSSSWGWIGKECHSIFKSWEIQCPLLCTPLEARRAEALPR